MNNLFSVYEKMSAIGFGVNNGITGIRMVEKLDQSNDLHIEKYINSDGIKMVRMSEETFNTIMNDVIPLASNNTELLVSGTYLK